MRGPVSLALLSAALAVAAPAAARHAPALSAQVLERELTATPTGPDADRLAERIREWFGGREALLAGAGPKVEGLTVAWAVELPLPVATNAVPLVGSDGVHFSRRMTRVGATGVFATVATLAHGDAFSWHFLTGTRRLGAGQLETSTPTASSSRAFRAAPSPSSGRGRAPSSAAPPATGGCTCRRRQPAAVPPR